MAQSSVPCRGNPGKAPDGSVATVAEVAGAPAPGRRNRALEIQMTQTGHMEQSVASLKVIHNAILGDPANSAATDDGILPLYSALEQSKLVIIGQAPGKRAQEEASPLVSRGSENRGDSPFDEVVILVCVRLDSSCLSHCRYRYSRSLHRRGLDRSDP
jgi:hypothetical protein